MFRKQVLGVLAVVGGAVPVRWLHSILQVAPLKLCGLGGGRLTTAPCLSPLGLAAARLSHEPIMVGVVLVV